MKRPIRESENHHILIHIAKFFIPIAAMLIMVFFLYITMEEGLFLGTLSMIGIELFSPFSVEASAPFGAIIGLDIATMVTVLVIVNVLSTLFIVWNFDLLRHLPYVGKFLEKFEKTSKKFMKKYNLENIGAVGLFLWFLSPLHASGSTTIAVLGKFINMDDKKLFAIVIIGTVVGAIIFSAAVYGIKFFFFS